MSGSIGRKKKNTIPVLNSRPDITSSAKPINKKVELPDRTFLEVKVKIKKMKPLARVRRRGWITPWKWPTLLLETSKYISEAPWLNIRGKRSTRQNQAIQVFLHELMHVALWDDTSITHSKDKNSLLYYYITGENIVPTDSDVIMLIKASERIGKINVLIDSKLEYSLLYLHISEAITLLNKWVGRKFFILKEID